MKDLVRMLLLLVFAVSVTWAASWVTGRGPPTVLSLQEEGVGQGPVPRQDSSPDAAAAAGEKVAIPDVTPAEIDAAMNEVEKVLAGKGRDPGEAAAETPLPADLPIALPSDI